MKTVSIPSQIINRQIHDNGEINISHGRANESYTHITHSMLTTDFFALPTSAKRLSDIDLDAAPTLTQHIDSEVSILWKGPRLAKNTDHSLIPLNITPM